MAANKNAKAKVKVKAAKAAPKAKKVAAKSPTKKLVSAAAKKPGAPDKKVKSMPKVAAKLPVKHLSKKTKDLPKVKTAATTLPGKAGAKVSKIPVLAVAPAAKGKTKQVVVVEVSSTVVVKKTKGAAPLKAAKEAKRRCKEPGCDNDAIIMGFCRLHYIKNWRRIKRKEAILATGQLNNYVEELVSKYPDKYLDVIRQDLSTEKDWAKVVVDMELDGDEDFASVEEEGEGASEGSGRVSGRDFDDEGDAF